MPHADPIDSIRSALERSLEPAAAERIVGAALRRCDEPPASDDAARTFVDGPLAEVLRTFLGPGGDQRWLPTLHDAIAGRADAIDAHLELEVDLDLDVDVEADSEAAHRTIEVARVAYPVRVLIASGGERVAHALLDLLGDSRVAPRTAIDEPTLRRAAFSESPLIAVVDASLPPSGTSSELADALAALPDRVLLIVVEADRRAGRELRSRLEERGVHAVYVDGAHGIEPVADLVLSRFARRESLFPK